jgi:FkbM family methyltransferase
MIAVYPFSPRDEEQALKNAKWFNDLGGCKGHEVVACYDPRCSQPIVEAIGLELIKAFDKVWRLPVKAEIDGWPQGANFLFRFAATWLESKPQWTHFLWLEPDAIPITPGWMDALEMEYKCGGKPFMGERVDLGEKRPDVPIHMSGIGIYQNPIYQLAGEAYRAHEVAWDIAAKDQILPHCYFTKLIQHYWKHGTFTHAMEVRPETVIFHSSKDGSLIDVLRGKAAPVLNQNSVETEPTSGLPSREEIGTLPAQPAQGIRKLRGDIWVLEGDNIISEQVVQHGRLDFDPLIPYVTSLIRPGDTVCDVGAFIGDHTIAYSQSVGKSGKVFAYEPNPVAFQCLVHNTNGMSNVFGFCHALGASDGVAGLVGDYASSYISHNNAEKGPIIQVRRLDIDAALFGQLDLIKIDVEGYELNVLKGMEQIITKFHPKMVIEINEIALGRQNTTAENVVSWLVRHGYEVSVLHRHGPDVPFYDILALAKQPPEISSGVGSAHSESPAVTPPVAAPFQPTIREEIEWHVGVLKQFSESAPQTKAMVMQKLVYAGLRLPNKKKKHVTSKTHKQTNGQREQPAKEHKT